MTTATLTARAHDGVVTGEDPAAKPTRRRFSAAYKLAILEEYERCSDSGEKGALLRREGLYTSHIVEWRRAKEVGALAGLPAGGRCRSWGRSPTMTVALPTAEPSSLGGPAGSRCSRSAGSMQAGRSAPGGGRYASRHVPARAPGGGYDMAACPDEPEAVGGQLALFA